jgi:hypothetical protein
MNEWLIAAIWMGLALVAGIIQHHVSSHDVSILLAFPPLGH